MPSWHPLPPEVQIAIRLDPGIAFGTGAHPTTQLCLRWLDQQLPPNARMLDYGCGSGILSICAARLGARSVVGIDIDAQALTAARANAQLNAVAVRYVTTDDLYAASAQETRSPQTQEFDLVMANILTNPLKVLAPTLTRLVAAHGHLVLSGILVRQIDEVIAVYAQAPRPIKLSLWDQSEGWACLSGQQFS